MHSLVVLSDQPRWNSFYSIVFPLYKWRSIFKKHGIDLRITTDKNDKYLKKADTAIIISRAFTDGWQNIKLRNSENEAQLISYLGDLKKEVKQLIWYDRSDSTGTTDFPIIEHVDVFLKNQLLKNLSFYTEQHGAKSVRNWLKDDENMESHFKKYYPCPADQIHKIKLGWNITHSDHRVFTGKKRIISNYIFTNPKLYKPSLNRLLDFSLRGSLNYGGVNSAISAQRNEMISVLQKMQDFKGLISSERISKPAFMEELANSKICFSPFGWGEICYRDFEIYIAGALMIKPTLNHLVTFPNVFIEDETYIPVSWEMTDLAEKLEDCLHNYSHYLQIAKNAQDSFVRYVNDPEVFVQHVKQITDNKQKTPFY